MSEFNKFFKYADPESGEEVVISGIAGRFPKSNNLYELKDNIFNRKDCVTDKGGKTEHSEIPQRLGRINNIEKFDASFFGIDFKVAHTMDPMGRMLLEHTYEAIVDAGIHPEDLRGTRTGVFIGSCFSDFEKVWYYDKIKVNGLGVISCSKGFLANRITHWLGVNGPSYNIDSACSSSLFAIEHAYRAIHSGQCDYAIVGGSNLCGHPYLTLQFKRLGVLSDDGRCKTFDEDADGYARSEAVAVIFLQKAKNAKRIYATVIHAKTNCDGYKEQGITFPSSKIQGTLLKEFYEECSVPTTSIPYIEAHGTGTKVGDPEEINAIDQVFTKGRSNPLKVGSIKSNLGHTEPASGVCSIAKAIISMESCLIPPNIHFNRPRKDVEAFIEGRIKVVTETIPFDGEYIGINSFGFGGANAHVLLRSNPKAKVNKGLPDDDLPRLVVVSGRTEEAVVTILNDIDNRPIDVEFVRLLHDLHLKETSGHLCRGYTITSFKSSDEKLREIENFSGIKKPILFVFSGMGSKLSGMGQALMRFPIFAKAMEKCDAVLKQCKLNIYKILTEKDNNMSHNILHSIVGIAAIQIGLVDLLTSLGVVPDYVIGHSVGELGCAYADGCFTAEEMILAAYSRGMALVETETPHGSMATVGLSYKDIKDWCPADIDIACHNGLECTIVSGPTESVKAFVKKLQGSEIFAEEISCNNIPYHSRYMAAVGSKLFEYLKNVITVAKPRSRKWLSTSVPRNEWSTPVAKLSSAEYHTNNIVKPVLFEETLALIPDNAVTIEIAPQNLLQAILRKSLQPTVRNIALNHRDDKNNVVSFLQALGKLYNTGLQLDLAKLYPHVEYPVSKSTPMISPLIRWKHSDDWFVALYEMEDKIDSGERLIEISITSDKFKYVSGHVVDGRNLFPATGYLCLVWETFSMMTGQLCTEMSVVIENVKLNRATTIPKEGTIEMTVVIQKGSGNFEVVEGNVAIVTGKIRAATNLTTEKIPLEVIKTIDDNEGEELDTKDIYKELKLRGYQYSGLFRSLHSASISGKKGHVEWKNNWVAFLDNILQMKILTLDTRGLFVPTGIRKLIIDTKAHQRYLQSLKTNEKYVPVRLFENIDVIVAGGVEIHNIRANEISRKKPVSEPIIEEHKFIAYRDRKEMSLGEILTLSMHITLENIPLINVKTIELVEDNDDIPAEKLVSPLLRDILAKLPLIRESINIFAPPNRFGEEDVPKDINILELENIRTDDLALLAVGYRLLTDKKKDSLKQLLKSTKDGAFILSREKNNIPLDFSIVKEFQLGIVLEKSNFEDSWILLRKIKKTPKNTLLINVKSNEFNWLKEVQTVLANETEEDNTRVILVEEGNFESGLLGFINCLQKEPGGKIFRAVLVQDLEAPKFSLELSLYSEQIETDLVINVLRPGNIWGSYRHQLLPSRESKPVYHAFVNQLSRGDLSSIRWVEGPIMKNYEKEDLVRIHYASLNFKDVMLTTGKIGVEIFQQDRKEVDGVLGMEYSGTSISGRRVMGLNSSRCISNLCHMDDIFNWTIPESWTLEDAATVPCVYSTCTAALYINGEMKKGESILIHAGAGGVGQAAITLALHEGCEVFTTVGTPEKRKFIKETFPSIDDNHIGNSRDTSFEQMILQQTNGRGVDIVLNSLAEEKLLASLRCLAHRGRFLEIGKFDLAANNPLDIDVFTKEISFHAVMLDQIMITNDEIKDEIYSRVKKLLKENAIKPIVRTVFGKDQVEEAFRFMAAGKHIGKVLIKIREDNEPLNTPILAEPSYTCFPNKSYIIIGGLGGFGLELIDWLVLRNAQNIVITSRNGLKNGYQQMRIKRWESYGANIKILVGLDAAKQEDCELIVKSAINEGPVDGIFNLAVSLKDSICRNQTMKTFEESFKGKAWATKRLDEVTRKLCPDLRHFVVFSSVSCGRGNAGQTNYGMANSVMERICEKRVEEGLPGLAIQWGAIGDVGLVADMQDNDKELVIGGTLQQKITSCLEELDRFLVQDRPIVASMIVAEKQSGSDGADNVVDTVLKIMCIKDLKTINQQSTLAELGMDSMMGVEIKQSLEREYQIYLSAEDIRKLNFAKLVGMNNERSDNNNHNETSEKKTFNGMKMLMQFFGEKLSSEIIVPLKTNPEEGRSEIFFIPGIEGFGSIFKTLESKIKSPATCFQLGSNYELKTIEEMAYSFLPHILKKLKDRIDFTLVGYSFGSLVTIELARQLEAKGFNGRLILIDGAPQLMKEIVNQYFKSSSEEELQNNVLVHITKLFTSTNSKQLEEELKKSKMWDEKLDTFFNSLSPEYKQLYLEGDQRNAASSVYIRLQASLKYNPKPIPYIRTPITLFKPVLPSVQYISYDYGLQNITEGKVEVHVIDGDHVTMLENIKIAMAINREPFKED